MPWPLQSGLMFTTNKTYSKLTGKLQVQPEVQSTSVMQPVETQDCREDSSNGLEATTVVKVKNKATVKKRIGKEFEMGDQE